VCSTGTEPSANKVTKQQNVREGEGLFVGKGTNRDRVGKCRVGGASRRRAYVSRRRASARLPGGAAPRGAVVPSFFAAALAPKQNTLSYYLLSLSCPREDKCCRWFCRIIHGIGEATGERRALVVRCRRAGARCTRVEEVVPLLRVCPAETQSLGKVCVAQQTLVRLVWGSARQNWQE